ncbi:hypothetical protein LG634_03610 [Streptomyces bambusae]|uniref:hypothetical protein n=1 Tax=Streptomyces bambusae TaxID=1550616 RepID=UPI001CFCB42A|nr:hypothetical protein [Streptomyces bambusae]MCB5163923.1 hypothetical protein [Streptomyces bambusae]
MFVFVCTGCGAELTAPLDRVELPVHARQKYGNGLQLPVLMAPGTFAVEPEGWGAPWRGWHEVGPDEAAERGVFAPVPRLSDAPPGAVVIAPGEAHGTVLVPENRGSGYCCGLDGAGGPNMACAACGVPVATRIDDCSLWQAVWLEPTAVRGLPVEGAEAAPLTWAEVLAAGERVPPYGPVVSWGDRPRPATWWSAWSPQWEAAAGRALAHLLVASGGQPVAVPDGLAAEVFQPALDALLPTGPATRHAVLAGPDLPVPGAGADVLLVPTHPQTGETWAPAAAHTCAYRVPLPFGVWFALAFPQADLPDLPAGRLPAGVSRDEDQPLAPPRPHHPFQVDFGILQQTLVRLPAVRRPWLRDILDDTRRHTSAGMIQRGTVLR